MLKVSSLWTHVGKDAHRHEINKNVPSAWSDYNINVLQGSNLSYPQFDLSRQLCVGTESYQTLGSLLIHNIRQMGPQR